MTSEAVLKQLLNVNVSFCWVRSFWSGKPTKPTAVAAVRVRFFTAHCGRSASMHNKKKDSSSGQGGQERTACVPSTVPKFHYFPRILASSQVIYSVVIHRALMKTHGKQKKCVRVHSHVRVSVCVRPSVCMCPCVCICACVCGAGTVVASTEIDTLYDSPSILNIRLTSARFIIFCQWYVRKRTLSY